MNCDVGYRLGSETILLWLWYRPTATALIRSLAWELPYATEAAKKKKKEKKKERKRKAFNVHSAFLDKF